MTLTGVALSPGVARGTVAAIQPAPPPADRGPRLDDGRSAQEQFRQARRDAEAELGRAIEALAASEGPARDILRAHLALLSDPMLTAAVECELAAVVTADAALQRAAESLTARFEALGDPALRQRAADVRDVCECIARQLSGGTRTRRPATSPCIVCAGELSAADVIHLAQDRPLAFVLEHGAAASHAAILLRALAVPAVVGVAGATRLLKDGDVVVVDGDRGRVLVGADSADPPSPRAVAVSAAPLDAAQPAVTTDGIAIAVTAAIASLADARSALAAGADGIGLFRTEMQWLESATVPAEDAQARFYQEIARSAGTGPLTVRLLDLGGDKRPPALRLPDESNPALGLRGVRFLLARPALLMGHLRALLRVDASRLRLLVPMVVDATDIARVRELADDAARAVGCAARRLEIGAMIETPAAALMAEELVAAADFLSIGTNDLAQYVLAADRDSEAMAPFHQPLHPAVLRLLRDVVARASRQNIPVSLCGEAAADRRAIPIFVGLGVTELSVRPSAVAGVKAQVRRIARTAARALAEAVVALSTAAAVAGRIDTASETETGIDVREACNPR